jgi:glycosyltransferase involved in cell wall biosynthesis
MFLIDIFAELIKINPNYQLILLSDGYLLDQVKNKVHDLGLDESVVFVGKTKDVPTYLQAMDLFILPSLHEGLPVVLVEAQAAGLPCVVADTVAYEADLTGDMQFINIKSTQPWIDVIESLDFTNIILKRKQRATEWYPKIQAAGYDIKKNAKKLEQCYYDAMMKSGNFHD